MLIGRQKSESAVDTYSIPRAIPVAFILNPNFGLGIYSTGEKKHNAGFGSVCTVIIGS